MKPRTHRAPEGVPKRKRNSVAVKPEPEPTEPSVKELLASLHDTVSKLHGRSKHQPCSESDFRRMWEHLKIVAPPPAGTKVKVQRLPSSEMSHDHGYCEKLRNVFTLTLDKGLTYYETEDKLIHEWAHMLNWKPHHPLEGDHGPTWGVEYAKVYSAYHGVK